MPAQTFFCILLIQVQPASAAQPATHTVPFSSVDGWITVDATVDGQGPFRFVIDSGAETNFLSPQAARALALTPSGKRTIQGAGERKVFGAHTRIHDIRIGSLTMRKLDFYVVSMPFQRTDRAGGIPIAGFLGFYALRQWTWAIDFEHRTLQITRGASFVYRGKGVAVPFRLSDHGIPVITGAIDGWPATFKVDTGDGGSLTLYASFAQIRHFLQRHPSEVKVITGQGVGGYVRSVVTRATSLTIGPFDLPNPFTEVSLQKAGACSDSRFAGTIGSAALSRFAIILDYAHHRIYFQKNDRYYRRDVFNRAGVVIDRLLPKAGLHVVDVIKGSPADRAGMAPGDMIETIDGRAAGSLTVSAVRKKFKQQAWTHVKLEYRSGGALHDALLVLRDLV